MGSPNAREEGTPVVATPRLRATRERKLMTPKEPATLLEPSPEQHKAERASVWA